MPPRFPSVKFWGNWPKTLKCICGGVNNWQGETEQSQKTGKQAKSLLSYEFLFLKQRKTLQGLQTLQVPSHSILSWSKQHEILSSYICTCDSCHLPLRSGWSTTCWDCISHYETLHAVTFSLQRPHFSYQTWKRQQNSPFDSWHKIFSLCNGLILFFKLFSITVTYLLWQLSGIIFLKKKPEPCIKTMLKEQIWKLL